MKSNEFLNESEQRLDPKCWKGYRKQGTKMKGDVRVNNCVKVGEDYSHDEYDDEAGMVDSNLETIKRAAEELDEILGQDDNMAEWAQEKLAVVKSMLVAVKDYVVSQKSAGIDPKVDQVAEDASGGGTSSGAVATSMGGGAGFGKSIFMSRTNPKTKKSKK
jgi:hypothetical protein